MNLIEKFHQGQAGVNKGLYMGPGLHALSLAINGVQKGRTYGIGAGPKVGKTTLVDCGFVIEPWLDAVKNNVPIEFIYHSYEIDRVSKEFDYTCHFLYTDFGIEYVELPEGQTVGGKSVIPLNSDFLMGQIQDDSIEKKIVTVPQHLKEKIIIVYQTRIIPLFGEFLPNGVQIKKGVIIFIEHKENPTGIRNKLLAYAKENGTFMYENEVGSGGKTYTKTVGYKPKDPRKVVLIIMDHLRKLPLERGFLLKQTIDKYLEYSTELRNLCNFSFVHIIHLNRSMADINRLKYLEDKIYPTSEDFKDTGNLSEECNYILTAFNPNDDKYGLKKHFGLVIKNTQNDTLYPELRTLHIVESRHCVYPQHFRVLMKGAVKTFIPFTPKS